MSIDIRNIPVSYLNLNYNVDRNQYILQHLALNGFCNKIHRQEAAISGQVDISPSITSGICQSLWYLYTHCNDDYVLHIEDDIEFENIDNLNEVINEAIKNDDFTAFVISNPEPQPRCYTPPEKKDCLGHFILAKRDKIPILIHGLYMTHVIINNVDNWGYNPCQGIYVYTGYECHQLHYYFQSNNRGDKRVIVTQGTVLFCKTDKDLNGSHIHVAINDIIADPIPIQFLAQEKHLLIRIFQLTDTGIVNILRPNGIVESFNVLPYIYEQWKTTKNDDILYRFIARYEGLYSSLQFKLNMFKYDGSVGKFIPVH